MKFSLSAVICSLFLFSGCGWGWKSSRLAELEQQADSLQSRLNQSEGSRQGLQESLDRLRAETARLQDQHARQVQQLHLEKGQETDELVKAQRQLAESLKKELGEAQAKLAMTERGLVLTFLDEIFFDSGKAVVKNEAFPVLEKVGRVLRETVPDSPVAVEGHTDNEPIKYSGWKSNWELSSARALAVVHHFIDKEELPPERVRAVGFGEYHPVNSSDTAEGRRQNRRVEVVILPKNKTSSSRTRGSIEDSRFRGNDQ